MYDPNRHIPLNFKGRCQDMELPWHYLLTKTAPTLGFCQLQAGPGRLGIGRFWLVLQPGSEEEATPGMAFRVSVRTIIPFKSLPRSSKCRRY